MAPLSASRRRASADARCLTPLDDSILVIVTIDALMLVRAPAIADRLMATLPMKLALSSAERSAKEGLVLLGPGIRNGSCEDGCNERVARERIPLAREAPGVGAASSRSESESTGTGATDVCEVGIEMFR